MEIVQSILWAVSPSVAAGILLAWWNHGQKKRDERDEKRERDRLKSEQLRIDMLMATCKLSYAVAMAVKRGKPNGEIEDGVEEYIKAVDAFKRFEREKMAEMGVSDG